MLSMMAEQIRRQQPTIPRANIEATVELNRFFRAAISLLTVVSLRIRRLLKASERVVSF
jgi:hypothetical protein